jgi:hypothetical protein
VVSTSRRLLIYLLTLSPLFGGESYYYLSYRLGTANGAVQLERLTIVPAMFPPKGKTNPLCRVATSQNDLTTIDPMAQKALLQCLLQNQTHIKGWDETTNNIGTRNRTMLIVPPLPVKATFHDGWAMIWKIENE